MHRAVVLTTLVLLSLAVAGVSASQESGIFAGGPNTDAPPGSTTLERASSGATVAEDSGKTALPGASSEPGDSEDTSEPTVVETEEPTVVAPVEETLAAGANNVGKPDNSGRGVGKPEHAGKSLNIGEPATVSGVLATASPKSVQSKKSMGAAEASKRSPSATRARTPSQLAPRRGQLISVTAIASERAHSGTPIG